MTTFVLPAPLETIDLTMEDGAIIRLRRHGNRTGPRLILSHGNGFATDGYYPFWRLLLERFEIILYDQRNHGQNPRHDDLSHHDVPWLVRDLERVLDGIGEAFGDKPVSGLLHSVSGIAAVLHALEYGWRWQALVLFDTPFMPSPGHPLYQAAHEYEMALSTWSKDRPARFPHPDALADHMASAKRLSRWVPGAHALMAQALLREEKATGEWVLRCPPEGESQLYAANAGLDLCPHLGGLGGPFKVVASDPEITRAAAPGRVNRALAELHGHPYEAVPGTSHMLQIEKPEAGVAAALAFLDEAGVAL